MTMDNNGTRRYSCWSESSEQNDSVKSALLEYIEGERIADWQTIEEVVLDLEYPIRVYSYSRRVVSDEWIQDVAIGCSDVVGDAWCEEYGDDAHPLIQRVNPRIREAIRQSISNEEIDQYHEDGETVEYDIDRVLTILGLDMSELQRKHSEKTERLAAEEARENYKNSDKSNRELMEAAIGVIQEGRPYKGEFLVEGSVMRRLIKALRG